MRSGISISFGPSGLTSCSFAFLFFLLGFLTSGVFQPVQAYQKMSGDMGEMLVGEISTEELYKECPVFKENAEEYVPDKDAITGIKLINDPISIIMFLGTWCGDSRRESPKLLKTLDVAKNPKISITIYGVDRNKNDAGGLAKKYNIERVPTIIFLKGGMELGRIIENPKDIMEADFLAIVGEK